MNDMLMAAWLDALRSERYKQGVHALRNKDNEFCPLGVLCDVVDSTSWELTEDGVYAWRNHIAMPPVDVLQRLKLTTPYRSGQEGRDFHLAALNDEEHLSFTELADVIERWYQDDLRRGEYAIQANGATLDVENRYIV